MINDSEKPLSFAIQIIQLITTTTEIIDDNIVILGLIYFSKYFDGLVSMAIFFPELAVNILCHIV